MEASYESAVSPITERDSPTGSPHASGDDDASTSHSDWTASPYASSDAAAIDDERLSFARVLAMYEAPRVLDEREARVFRRVRAAKRERRRLAQHRNAFEALQGVLPGNTKRLSRLDILQLATNYIFDLTKLLHSAERQEAAMHASASRLSVMKSTPSSERQANNSLVVPTATSAQPALDHEIWLGNSDQFSLADMVNIYLY